MKAIKRNMQEQIGTDDHKILHCLKCGAEFSGNAGDYWDCPSDHVFTCDCGGEMELVNKVITIKYTD